MPCEDLLQRHSKHIMALDRWFYIEMAFLDHVTKEGGAKELEEQYKRRCSSTGAASLQEALRAAELLMSESLFSRVSKQAQNGVIAASTMVRQLINGQPAVVGTGTSPFLKWVHDDLVNFVRDPDEGEGLAGDAVILRGVPALKSKYTKVLKSKKPEMKDVEVLCLHASAALNADERAQLHKVREQVLSQLQKPAKASQAKAKPSLKRRAPAEFDGDAQVMRLLES